MAFGRFFPSVTKPEATPAALDILTGARTQLDIPLVAIGGINADNGGSLIEAGADMLAVIHGLFGELDQPNAEDIRQHVRQRADRLTSLFSRQVGVAREAATSSEGIIMKHDRSQALFEQAQKVIPGGKFAGTRFQKRGW